MIVLEIVYFFVHMDILISDGINYSDHHIIDYHFGLLNRSHHLKPKNQRRKPT
jgi:hypothetical protein